MIGTKMVNLSRAGKNLGFGLDAEADVPGNTMCAPMVKPSDLSPMWCSHITIQYKRTLTSVPQMTAHTI